MKKQLINLIKELDMDLARQNGEWGLSVPAKNKPTQDQVKIIMANKQDLIKILQKQKEERIAKEQQEKENKGIVVEWQEGTPLSGYAVRENKDMMVELGLAKMVSGWGYIVAKEVIEALGTTFTVAEAKAYIESLKEDKKENTKEEILKNLKETAKKLGHKVEIKSYNVKCDGSVAECDTDIITEYIDSKGNITKTRVHTH